MKREELLGSPEHWLLKMQLELYEMVSQYQRDHERSAPQMAELLAMQPHRLDQVLRAEYNPQLKKLSEMALKLGKVPVLRFLDLEEVLALDQRDASTDETGLPRARTLEVKFSALEQKKPTPKFLLDFDNETPAPDEADPD